MRNRTPTPTRYPTIIVGRHTTDARVVVLSMFRHRGTWGLDYRALHGKVASTMCPMAAPRGMPEEVVFKQALGVMETLMAKGSIDNYEVVETDAPQGAEEWLRAVIALPELEGETLLDLTPPAGRETGVVH